MSIVGKNIKQLRKKEDWTQAIVAKKLGLSIPAFSKIEAGVTDINITRLEEIAKIFGVSKFDIMYDGTNNTPSMQTNEIKELNVKIIRADDEILKLQSKVIDLYEELDILNRNDQ